MTRLSDTQLIVLSSAAQRESGSLYPLPETFANDDKRAAGAVAALIKRGLAELRETDNKPSIARVEGGVGQGVFLTRAGYAAINIDDSGEADGETGGAVGNTPAPAEAPTPRPTKSALVVDLLRRGEGATLAELIEATGWLPHTTRAALTGLRKKGHAIERGKRGADSCYRIAA